ncbi:MAG: tail fiber domain-containing protein, partial [Bacteroidota bacterium]
MMKNSSYLRIWTLSLFLSLPFLAQAQVGINETNTDPDPSAMLDVQSTSKGMLVPRMTETERDNIGNPATGLLIYVTNNNQFQFFNGSIWLPISGMISPASMIADTDGDTKIQTEANQDEDIIRFDIGGTEYFIMDSARLEIIADNIFIGDSTGERSGGILNIGIGDGALISNNGNFNIAIGDNALLNNDTGNENVALGTLALTANTTGSDNVGLGAQALKDVSSGENNIGIGEDAGAGINTGSNNVIVGDDAGRVAVTGDSPDGDVTANVIIGASAGSRMTGDSCIIIGYTAGRLVAESQRLYIENSPSTNPLIYGNFKEDTVRINGTLDINDAYSFPDADGANGQVLVSDGTGNVSWANSGLVDNLGDHTATQNLQLANKWVTNNGVDSLGFRISNTGQFIHHSNSALAMQILAPDRPVIRFRQTDAGGYPAQTWDVRASEQEFIVQDITNNSKASFRIKTGSENNRITINGNNVGIGLSTTLGNFPSATQALDVGGQIRMRVGAADGYVPTSDADGVMTWTDPLNLPMGYLATQNIQMSDYWLSNDGDNEGVFVDATGKVGIGTDSPGERLNVNGNLRLDGDNRKLIFRSNNTGGTNLSEIRTNVDAPAGIGGSDNPWDNYMRFHVARNNSGGNLNVMHLQGDGRVGLGTTDPLALLHLDFADQGDTSGIMLSAGSSNSVIYHQDSDLIIRKLAHTNTLVLDASGNVGIGTASPNKAKLEIVGSGSSYTVSGASRYYGSGGVNNNNGYSGTFSLYANGIIGAAAYVAHSDMRIKQIEGLSNSEDDLETLMQIEVTDYRLLDTLAQGNAPVKKVIAQQVAEVYPQAVTNDLTEVVPDIYQRAAVQDGWIMLATNLTVGERVKLISEHSNEVYEVIAVEAHRFQVSSLASQNASLAQTQSVFVFGREVKDFHTVDYEAISMLNVSATQE